ncbi:hypothetical protein [Corallococcus exiguus]|uniref:hypothetical protein n=1 Tax=Corallococcus exiguus TaxID=83462 RepID=UPI0015603E2F|nr:hypothetical protein [Corallococcus exiguus]NRD54467.1 hypothetical protein [Corallococcus exiguus]
MSEGHPTPEKLRRAIVRAFHDEGLSYAQIAYLLLVFLDESFCNTSIAREYGWAPVGQRARGVRPGSRWTT